MGDILVICEVSEGQVKKYSKELCYKASQLAEKLGCTVHAVAFGADASTDAATLGSYGVSKVTVVTDAEYAGYDPDHYLSAVSNIIDKIKPSFVFASATPIGRDLLPRVAVKYDGGMATECVDILADGSSVTFRRPVYAGKAWVDVKINSTIKFATTRPNVFPVKELKTLTANVEKVSIPTGATRVKLKEKVQSEAKQVDLVEANVIVSGGRAMGSAENYGILRELASCLNASIGASRAAVDAGYISHDHQVGQTGKTVNPSLYIACGISGAIQHLAGMRTSKVIVAINKDPDAPIFAKADFGIVGDLFKVVPALTQKLKKALSE